MQMDQQASLHIHWLVCSAVPALAMHACISALCTQQLLLAARLPARPALSLLKPACCWYGNSE
jgi:hypothetical protein